MTTRRKTTTKPKRTAKVAKPKTDRGTVRTSKKAKRSILVPDKLRDKRQAKFLEYLANGQAVQYACDSLRLGRTTVYAWRERFPDFRRAWDEAIERSTELLEREAYRRACEGVSEGVYYQGELVTHEKRYSDTLLIFLLKARRPSVYRENQHVTMDVTARPGAPQLDLSKLSETEIEELERLRAKAAGDGSTN